MIIDGTEDKNRIDSSDGGLDCDGDLIPNSVEYSLGSNLNDDNSKPAPGNYYEYYAIGRV